MKVILFLAACALALWAITGCAAPNPPSACPPLREYTAEENARLLHELEQLPPGAFTIDVIADYMLLRDQVRACQ